MAQAQDRHRHRHRYQWQCSGSCTNEEGRAPAHMERERCRRAQLWRPSQYRSGSSLYRCRKVAKCVDAGRDLAILPRVCGQQGLPWSYGDVKPWLYGVVYRTQEMGGLRAARADRYGYPPLSSLFVTNVWTRAWIWDPRYQTACMQAGVYGGLTGCVAYRGLHLNSPSCT